MDAHSSAEMDSFGQRHFGKCELGDKRLSARVVFTTDRLMEHPGGTLPDKLNNNADLVGFYRLANNPKVTHAKLMDAHRAHVRELMERCGGVVLVIHDTTEIDFSGLESVDELGPIGHGGCSGFLCHNSLAYDYQSAQVLGLAAQTIHVRRKAPKGESPTAKREHPQRESRLWKKGWTALAPPPPGQMRVNIADRGADMFEFIEALQQGGDHYVIRSKSNRNIELDDGAGGVRTIKLHDHARTLAPLGTRQVQVSTNHGHKARSAKVRVAGSPMAIKAPHFARGEHSKESQPAWVAHVIEIDPPKGEAALEWILLTNVALTSFEEVCRCIDWYACRPIIEEYHKAMKTGCGIEQPQFTTGHALQVTIAMLSVVATQLLRLRDLARRSDAKERPASEVVDAEYVVALGAWRFKEVRSEMSVHEFCRALGKLGGHLNRKHDGAPGWLVLWRGWTKLQLLVDGARIGRNMRCV